MLRSQETEEWKFLFANRAEFPESIFSKRSSGKRDCMNISSELTDTVRHALSPKKIREQLKWVLPLVVGLLPTLIIAVLSILSLPVFNEVDLKIYDYFLLSSRLPASAHAPLIVDIDEQSLDEYGQWPWPRFLIAELLKKINQGYPLAVGVDIMFSEPDRTSLTQIYQKLARHFDVKIPEAEKIPDLLQDNDALLSDVLRQGNFVTSFYFTSDGRVSDHNCTVRPLNIIIHQDSGDNAEKHEPLGRANGVICNLPLFDNAAAVHGFLNVEADSDGILRRVPLLMKYQDEIYPHLSLATPLLTEVFQFQSLE
ncbi:MAG: CHASE2 domain-containing protein, partial [Candidatus Electrothrix sp. EH2]|nr:CHASE2 domain-containing protein [Candidatus Electrothrix sp. EH2]